MQPWSQQISSLSNTTVVAIFTNVCLWRRSLCSNLAGIDREKLYRAIFICQYGLCCCICPNFCSTVLGNLQKFFGQMVYRPPWQKIARTPMKMSFYVSSSLSSGYFPPEWKNPLVSPVRVKPGDDYSFQSIRPVRNLQFVLKLTKRAVSNSQSHGTVFVISIIAISI